LFNFISKKIGKVKSVLLPALNFMRIDENDEPDLDYIEKYFADGIEKISGIIFSLRKVYLQKQFGEI